MQPFRLVAVDSNILLALAEEEEDAMDAWEIIRTRLRPVLFIVPPTALDEIGHQAGDPRHPDLQRLAMVALRDLRTRWMIQGVELRSDQEAIVEQVAAALSQTDLLPAAERNDAFILAEAAVLESALLVSQDSHLHGIDRDRLQSVLAAFDLTPPLIASPREIVTRFYH